MSALPSSSVVQGLRTRVAVRAGLATASLSKALGRGEGSVIGGRVSLAIDPHSLERLAVGRTVALVSATNGKTTTCAMLAAAMRTSGAVVTNGEGANMFGGMVSALSRSNATTVVLEVDEGHLPKALAMTGAQFVLLMNLSRDQLDRVGEVRMQAQKWRDALAGRPLTVVANADDPIVVWAALAAERIVWVAAGSAWRLDAASCPACGSRIDWQDVEWACTGCDLRRPEPHAHVDGDELTAGGLSVPTTASALVDGSDEKVFLDGDDRLHLPLALEMPGDVNRRNAAVALTAAVLMGADPVLATTAVSKLKGAAGRFQSVTISGLPCRLLLAKNPAGWTEALRIARPAPSPLVVAINARVQDGRDPSWLWDVPFEQLRGRFVVATGERGRDLAVRLRYADVEHVFVDDALEAVRAASTKANGDELDVIGNYSAFQTYRKLVS